MTRMTTTTLSDLKVGDRISSVGPTTHANGLVVTGEVAPIEPGSPVEGVRCGTLPGGVEAVLYVSQSDGHKIVFDRPES